MATKRPLKGVALMSPLPEVTKILNGGETELINIHTIVKFHPSMSKEGDKAMYTTSVLAKEKLHWFLAKPLVS